jgi:hypothetical protein
MTLVAGPTQASRMYEEEDSAAGAESGPGPRGCPQRVA